MFLSLFSIIFPSVNGSVLTPNHPFSFSIPVASSSSPRVAPDLEQARPTTSGEEELQLQLALAMSREESEKVRLTEITHTQTHTLSTHRPLILQHMLLTERGFLAALLLTCYVCNAVVKYLTAPTHWMVVKHSHCPSLLGHHFPEPSAESDIINSVCDVVNNGTLTNQCQRGALSLASEWKSEKPDRMCTLICSSPHSPPPISMARAAVALCDSCQLLWEYINAGQFPLV